MPSKRYSAEEAYRRMIDLNSDESCNSGEETDSDTNEQPQDVISPILVEAESDDFDSSQSSLSSEESELTDVFVSRNGTRWCSRVESTNMSRVGRVSHQNILRRNPGVKQYVRNRVSTALDAWEETIDHTILQKVASYSNASRPNNTPEITVDDLKQFIALQYARGLYGRHIPRDFLWNKQFGIQIFKDTMPRSKFRHLSKILLSVDVTVIGPKFE